MDRVMRLVVRNHVLSAGFQEPASLYIRETALVAHQHMLHHRLFSVHIQQEPQTTLIMSPPQSPSTELRFPERPSKADTNTDCPATLVWLKTNLAASI